MKKSKTGLTGGGIFIVAVAAVILFVVRYNKSGEEQILLRILDSLLTLVLVFLGAGVIYVALTIIMYGASKLSEEIFIDKPERDMMEAFHALTGPFLILCIAASYTVCLLSP